MYINFLLSLLFVVASASNDKTSDMPAPIVLLLFFIFTSLALICIREVRKDYLSQQAYLMQKSTGNTISADNYTHKSYGSTRGPIDHTNIDDYIDDNLYGNNTILDRVNNVRLKIVQRFVNYMEKTPEPVLFDANPDTSIGAFNEKPIISVSPKSPKSPIQHSQKYNPQPSPSMQRLMEIQCEKNKKRKSLNSLLNDNKNQYDEIKDNDNDKNDDEYDDIPDDSDKELDDSDNNGGQSSPKLQVKMEKKIVILDLD